ncbi:MAG: ParB/RepB/Spo0J family partition protein [Acidobacteria bacterium]|nr:ParB/RepB/Spo0J family partition protein [Acidobacteriota bacterium]
MKKNAKQNGAGNSTGAFLLIRLGEIELSPTNTRQIDDKSLADLAASIRQNGVLQPILVRPIEAESAKYQIVAGERRFRAAGLAELKEIPAQVRAMSDDEALSLQIIENLQREDLHPIDEAESFRRLREAMGVTVREMAQRVAKDARYVARRLSLTNLIEEGREDFRKERITLAHAFGNLSPRAGNPDRGIDRLL